MCWNFRRGWKFVQIEHVYVSISIEVPLLHGCTSLNKIYVDTPIERVWTQFARHLNTFLEYGWRTGKSTDSDIFHWGGQICTNFGSEWEYQQIDLTRYTCCILFRWQPRFWRTMDWRNPSDQFFNPSGASKLFSFGIGPWKPYMPFHIVQSYHMVRLGNSY